MYENIVVYRFTVSRDTLLHDAYEAIMSCSARDLRKMKIAISFEGEEGYLYIIVDSVTIRA